MWTAKGMRKTKYAIKIAKGVGNANKNNAIQGIRACTASAPQVVTIVWLSSVADLMNPVIPQSLSISRNDDFTLKVDHAVMSIGMLLTHQNIYASSTTSDISLNSGHCSMSYVC